MHVVGQVIEGLLWFFIALLWIRFVVDWVQVFARSWSPRGSLLVLLEVVYSVTDPPIKALRRVIPPLRIGSIALDLSFLIVMIGAYVLLRVNRAIFSRLTVTRRVAATVTPAPRQALLFDRQVTSLTINEWVRSCR